MVEHADDAGAQIPKEVVRRVEQIYAWLALLPDRTRICKAEVEHKPGEIFSYVRTWR
jgi:hypothetical protein